MHENIDQERRKAETELEDYDRIKMEKMEKEIHKRRGREKRMRMS